MFGGERRETLDMVNPGIYQWKSSGFHEHSSTTDGRNATEIVQLKEQQSHNDLSQNGKTSRDGERKHRQQQQEMPQPKFMHKQQNQQKEHAQLSSQVQAPPQKSQQQQQVLCKFCDLLTIGSFACKMTRIEMILLMKSYFHLDTWHLN